MPKLPTYTDQEFKRMVIKSLKRIEEDLEQLKPVDKTAEILFEEKLRQQMFGKKRKAS